MTDPTEAGTWECLRGRAYQTAKTDMTSALATMLSQPEQTDAGPVIVTLVRGGGQSMASWLLASRTCVGVGDRLLDVAEAGQTRVRRSLRKRTRLESARHLTIALRSILEEFAAATDLLLERTVAAEQWMREALHAAEAGQVVPRDAAALTELATQCADVEREFAAFERLLDDVVMVLLTNNADEAEAIFDETEAAEMVLKALQLAIGQVADTSTQVVAALAR